MNSCLEMLEILSAWLDGEAQPHEIEQMQQHLQQCPACQHQHQAWESMGVAVRQLPPLTADVSSRQLTATALQAASPKPARARLRLSPLLGQAFFYKVLPTVLVLLWCWGTRQQPWLFWVGFTTFGFGLFGLALRRAAGWRRPGQDASLRPWFEAAQAFQASVRPLGWSLAMLTFFPLAALLSVSPAAIAREWDNMYEYPGYAVLPSWKVAMLAGPCLTLVAVAGALLGLVQASSEAKATKAVPWLSGLTATLVWLTGSWFWPHALEKTCLVAVSATMLGLTGWTLYRLKENVAGEPAALWSLMPRYPLFLAVLDSTVLGVAWVLDQLDHLGSDWEDVLVFSLGPQPQHWCWPVLIWLWLILVRSPLASLLELTRGTQARWFVGAAVGLLAGVAGWGCIPSPSLTLVPLGVAAGLVLAGMARQRITPDRQAFLRQRLLVWPLLPILLAGGPLAWFWTVTSVPPEPALSVQIRFDSQQRLNVSVPPAENGYRYVQTELTRGLAAPIPGNLRYADEVPWESDRPTLERLVQQLQPNLAHLEQCLSVPGYEDLGSEYLYVEHLTFALQLRASGHKVAGRWAEAVHDYLLCMGWSIRSDGHLRPDDGHYRGIGSETREIINILNQHPLSATQYGKILTTLESYPTDPGSIVKVMDDCYADIVDQNSHSASLLPGRYYRLELSRFGRDYLLRRHALVERPLQVGPEPSAPPGSPHHQHWMRETWESERRMRYSMTYTEGLRVLTALHLFRSQTGGFPENLSYLDGLVGHRPCNYLSPDGQFRYRRSGRAIQLSAPGTLDRNDWTLAP
ncbi:zf-HC2 domain-containing protein [bacterium]|nr:zf-HC2 domain-containing protein [bacterium]